jgi:hypothetical protein
VLTGEVTLRPRKRCVSIVLFLALIGSSVVSVGPWTGVAEAGDKESFSLVRLRLSVQRSGMFFVNGAPGHAKLWRQTEGKPAIIRWETWNGSPYEELYWEIRFNSDDAKATENFFGDVDVPCGEDTVDIRVKKKPDVANAEWPYTATVFACQEGAKAVEVASMAKGLRIIWKD